MKNHTIVTLLLALCSGPVAAQEAIGLQEAVALARQNNLGLLQQGAAQKSAALATQIQKTLRLPSLDVSATATYLSELNTIDIAKALGNAPVVGKVELGGHDRYEFVLGVRQPVFTGFRIRSQIDLAVLAELTEEAKLQLLDQHVVHQVMLIYYQAQSLAKQERIFRESMKRLDVQAQNVHNLFEAAQVMAFDTLQVNNQALQLAIELEKNAVQRRLLELQLARVLNLAEARPLQLAKLMPPHPLERSQEELRQIAREHRPELASIRLALRGMGIRRTLHRSNYLPAVFAQANFHYAKPGLDPVANEWMDYFSAGLSLQWNLWRWGGDRNRLQQVQVEANRLTLRERELLRRIDYEVSEQYENLAMSLREIELAGHLRDQQAERYRIVAEQHRNGVASTNDLVSAETDFTRSELQYQLALVKYYVSDANLKLAVGTISSSR